MPAGQDLIYFNNSEDWELIVNTSRTARIIGENSHTPIDSFDLGVSLNSTYIAAIAGTTQGKPTWFFAGDITQSYVFAKHAGNPVLGKVRPERTKLALNRLQVIEANRITLDPYRLEYTPPAWFKNCTIRVYKYVGATENFVEDTLFDIGNAVGIDPNAPNDRIDKRLDRLEQLIADLANQISGGGKDTGTGTNPTPKTNGSFTPKEPQEEIVNAYFRGFL